jgi:hypothetical protein
MVSGIVRAEETGLPLRDALVRVAAPAQDLRTVSGPGPNIHQGRTNNEGRFQIQVPEAETLAVDVQSPGFETVSGTWMRGTRFPFEDVPFSGHQLPEFEIKLKPALYVAGVVVDEDGQPFPEAEVEAALGNGSAYVKVFRADPSGRFEVFDYTPEPDVFPTGRLRFEHPSMLRSQVDDVYALDAKARASLRIVMRRGHHITGTVISAGGRPAIGAWIEAVPPDPNAQYKQAITDADGRFLLEGLPDGEVVVRVQSFELEQKAGKTVTLAGADADVEFRLAPVVMKNPLALVNALGMQLADITPELKEAYSLPANAKGVLVVHPGADVARLHIGPVQEGEYFFMVGNKDIATAREMIEEITRINALPKPSDGWAGEGYRGSVRIVYANRHRTNTQYLALTDADAAALKKLLPTLSSSGPK